MNKKVIVTGLILGLLAIVFGAFGAHALKKVLSIEALNSFEIGVKYQMYHALFLLFLGIENKFTLSTKKNIYALVVLGIILFSGSIYLLAINSLTAIDFKVIGFLTPIGGLLLILAWILLLIDVLKKDTN